jgi:hypothetical protein
MIFYNEEAERPMLCMLPCEGFAQNLLALSISISFELLEISLPQDKFLKNLQILTEKSLLKTDS